MNEPEYDETPSLHKCPGFLVFRCRGTEGNGKEPECELKQVNGIGCSALIMECIIIHGSGVQEPSGSKPPNVFNVLNLP